MWMVDFGYILKWIYQQIIFQGNILEMHVCVIDSKEFGYSTQEQKEPILVPSDSAHPCSWL